MNTLLLYVPALACAAMMLIICVPMMRKMAGSKDEPGAVSGEEITELRKEIALLRAEAASPNPSEVANG